MRETKFKTVFTLTFKLALLFVTGFVFLLSFSGGSPWLMRLSRTSFIVSLTYLIIYFLMTRIYGGLDIGKRKSKAIINSMALTVLFSDIVAYIFLCIMNVTVVHHGQFVFEQPLMLLVAYVAQIVLINIFTRAGNDIYFKVYKPQSCVLILKADADEDMAIKKLNYYKKQFVFDRVAKLGDADIYEKINDSDVMFMYGLPLAERTHFLDYGYSRSKDVYFSPEITDMVISGAERILFDDISMLYVSRDMKTYGQRAAKRLFDIIVAAIGIGITSPIMLVTAIAIKSNDHGKVFYRQNRLTVNGQQFEILKFRSMKEEVGDIHRSVTVDDDRITKVGHFIRKYRIDELPQLFNVIKGQMSIVGPRPEMVENIDKYTGEIPEFAYRLRAKAGLTGYAQIYGKYDTSPKDKLILDLYYIENYSVGLDFKIVFLTLLVLLSPERSTKAFEGDKDEKEK